MTDPREDKLPKWARELLAEERFRADDAERKLAAHLETVEPSPIWYGNYDNPIYVPSHHGYQTVHFSITNEPTKHFHEQIGIAYRDGGIEVRGGRPLVMKSIASNVVQIGLEGR